MILQKDNCIMLRKLYYQICFETYGSTEYYHVLRAKVLPLSLVKMNICVMI